MKYLELACLLAAASVAAPAQAEECVDIELRAEIIPGSPLDALALFYSLANCGTVSALADIVVALERNAEPVGELSLKRFLLSGREFEHQWSLPVPPAVPAGTYRLCVTVTLGEASDQSCASIEIDAAGNILAFTLENPTPVAPHTWGEVKQAYK